MQKISQRRITLIAAAFLAVSLVPAICGCASSQAGVDKGNQAAEDRFSLTASDKLFGGSNHPNKLAGAKETTDENGIVHGVTESGIRYTVRGRGTVSGDGTKVTLIAAGDQIGTDDSLPIADAYAGSVGDGKYDFAPFYKEVKPMIQKYDLRFVNQETVMAGGTYSGYPVFNTPSAAAKALHDVGFNLVNFATNHIYDKGLEGVEKSHKVFAKYPEMLIAGSYLSQKDRETVQMIEVNGMTFAMLAYTYGDNFYGTASNFPNSYYNCGFSKKLIKEDVKRAQEVADAVIVAMHWGTEYESTPNDQEVEYAKFLADLDVDLVLGTHAHIMQPTKYVKGDSGNVVPVVYGLSDFVSGWTLADTHLSGLFTCAFSWASEDEIAGEASAAKGGEGGTVGAGGVKISNLAWYPTIEWSDGGPVYVRLLKGMDKSEVNSSTRVIDVAGGDYYTHYRKKVESVGMEIPVKM